MNTNEVITLARQAGFSEIVGEFACNVADLQRFAYLVAQREREECAKECDVYAKSSVSFGLKTDAFAAGRCAAAIRQRGNQS